MLNIVILATNLYVPLGVRLIKNLNRYYEGILPLRIYVYSNDNFFQFLPEDTKNVFWIPETHNSWQQATNSKFKNIKKTIKLFSLQDEEYLFYLDADTNINKPFEEHEIIEDLVGAEHHHHYIWKGDGSKMPFDRNPQSKSYVSPDSKLPAKYFQGAFFGGKIEYVKLFCDILINWQIEDRKIFYEPDVNDESYINKFFHITPPSKAILYDDFPFQVSCKGGISDQRIPKPANQEDIEKLIELKDTTISIIGGEIVRG